MSVEMTYGLAVLSALTLLALLSLCLVVAFDFASMRRRAVFSRCKCAFLAFFAFVAAVIAQKPGDSGGSGSADGPDSGLLFAPSPLCTDGIAADDGGLQIVAVTVDPTNGSAQVSASWSTNLIPAYSRIELHHKTNLLDSVWSPRIVYETVCCETNHVFAFANPFVDLPVSGFWRLFADVLELSFPGIASVPLPLGRRLHVATETTVPVSVTRSSRSDEYTPYDRSFAENPFCDIPGLAFDPTNGTLSAGFNGAFALPAGNELLVLSPTVSYGTPHGYAGDAYPLDAPCLYGGFHVGTNAAFGCSCVPGFSYGADVSAYPQISNSVTVVDDVAVAKVFLNGSVIWSNSCEHVRYAPFGGRGDLFSTDECSGCGGCAAGDCEELEGPSLGSVRFRIPLGVPRENQVSGFLWFKSDAPFTPRRGDFKVLSRSDAAVEDLDWCGLRHVICRDSRGRMVTVSNTVSGVGIRIVDTATGALDCTWRIDCEGDAMRFRKFSRLDNLMSDESFSCDGSGVWTRCDNVSGLVETKSRFGSFDAEGVWTETVLSCSSVTGSHMRVLSERIRLDDGSCVDRETVRREKRHDGTWADSRASYWTYGGSRRGSLRFEYGDDRAWSWHDYDEDGRETFRLDQRDGSAAPDDLAYDLGNLPDVHAFATVLDYAPLPGDGGHVNDADKARTCSRYVVADGVATLIGRTWTKYRRIAVNGFQAVEETVIRAVSASASVDDPANAVSVKTSFADDVGTVPYALRGEKASCVDEDGVATLCDHVLATGVLRTVERTLFNGHECRTRSVTERDAVYGNVLYEATQLTVDPSVEFAWRRMSYDDRNRLRSTRYDDGSSETNAYSCCRLLWRVDRAGAKTLRSAVTGRDRLYFAEEDEYTGEFERDPEFFPGNCPTRTTFAGLHRVRQHYLDAFGRETNVVTRAGRVNTTAEYPGSDCDCGDRETERTVYPVGYSDLVDRIDAHGLVARSVSVGTASNSVSSVSEYGPAGETYITVTNVSVRGGGSVSVRSADGRWTRTAVFDRYSADGCRTTFSVTDSSDSATMTNSVVDYDFLGRVVRSVSPESDVRYVYEGSGARELSSHDALSGLAVTNVYDVCGEIIGSVSAGVLSSAEESYEFVSGGWWRVTSESDSSGGVTNSLSVSKVRLTGLSDALRSEELRYLNGTLVEHGRSSFDSGSKTLRDERWSEVAGTRSVSVRFGREVAVTTPAGIEKSYYDYFAREHAKRRTAPDGASLDRWRYRDFGPGGDVVADGEYCMAAGGNSAMRWKWTSCAYDPRGNPVASMNEIGDETWREYDGFGNLVREEGGTYPMEYGYDTAGRRVSLGSVYRELPSELTTWGRDPVTGWVVRKCYPDGSAVTNTWTADGLLLRETRSDGRWCERVYDASRRFVGLSSDDPSCAYVLSLDAFGRTVSAAGSAAQYAYDFDCNGVATNESAAVGTQTLALSRETDAVGRTLALAVGDVRDVYRFDPTNACLLSVSNADAVVTYAHSFDLRDRGYALELTNGLRFVRTLSRDRYQRDNILTVTNSVGGGETGYRYRYDLCDRPVSRNGDTFAYNWRGECAAACVAGSDERYDYDSYGNLSHHSCDGTTAEYSANALNQYVCVYNGDGTNAFLEYHADGGLAEFGGRRYEYDSLSRLVSVSEGGTLVVSNRYDHLGRRVEKTASNATHAYFYDGWLLVREVVDRADDTRDVIEYHWGKDLSGTMQGAGGIGGLLYLKLNGAIYIPFYDAYGNVMGYWDEQGDVVAAYVYDAFGKTVSQTGSLADVFVFRFSTKYFDPETGLYYYGYRFYSPELMRWLTRDPIEEEGGVNLYAMCENDLVSGWDRLGCARMLTGALVLRQGRLVYDGEKYAREILRYVQKLNSKTDFQGKIVYDAKVVDFALTPIAEIQAQVDRYPDDTYLIAHGGITKNNMVIQGVYYWRWFDKAIEGYFPNGPKSRRFVPLQSLGPKLRAKNVYGCYVSPGVRKVDGVSRKDSYTNMYRGLLEQVKKVSERPRKSNCQRVIRIFEGENSGSGLSTEASMNRYVLYDERFYEEWTEDERARVNGGAR